MEIVNILWFKFYFLANVLTKAGNLKGPEREDLISWVTKCWSEISPKIIQNSFQKAKLNKS